jgi:hypothetical protein
VIEGTDMTEIQAQPSTDFSIKRYSAVLTSTDAAIGASRDARCKLKFTQHYSLLHVNMLGQNFVACLVGPSISSALKMAQTIDIALTSNELLRHSLSTMDNIDVKRIGNLGSAEFDKNDLVSYAISIRSIRAYCDGSSQWINIYRQRIMLCESRVTSIVKDIVSTHCSVIVDEREAGVNDGDWLTKLTREVMGLIRGRHPIQACSSDYFDSEKLTPVTFTEETSTRRHVSLREFKHVVLDYVRRIILCWFGLEYTFLAESRAFYITCLTSALGYGCLLLPDVWDNYVNFPLWLFTHDCPRLVNRGVSSHVPFDNRYMEGFKCVVSQLCKDKRVRLQMDNLQQVYLDLFSNAQLYVSGVVSIRTSGSSLRQLLASSSSDTPALSHTHTGSSTSKVPTQNDSEHNGQLSNPSLLVPPISLNSKALAVLECMLEDAYVASEWLLKPGSPPLETRRPIKEMYHRSDFLLPLRESASSRHFVNEMLTHEFAKTRAGLFSMQIFRFIHFGSNAFVEFAGRQVEFDSCESYCTYMRHLFNTYPDKHPSFFCDKKAFGQTIRDRTWDRYQDYWTISQSNAFIWPPDRKFASTWRNVNHFKDKFNDPALHGTNLPPWRGVGKLNLYMLVADMCAAGLVDPPTVDDMAGIVVELRMGALAGLVSAGFCLRKCSPINVRTAFVTFYHDMTNTLSEEQANRFNWNPIVAEHMLCKFSRLLNMGVYKL